MFCGKALPRHNLTIICWSIKWVLWSTARIPLKLFYSTYLLYGFHLNRYIAQEQIPCSEVTFNKVVVTNNKVIATITQWFYRMYKNSILCMKWFVHQANANGAFHSVWTPFHSMYVRKLHFMYELVRTSSKYHWSIYRTSGKCRWSIYRTARKRRGTHRVVHKSGTEFTHSDLSCLRQMPLEHLSYIKDC